MFQKLKDNFMKKSLNERFLLFMGILLFLIYLTFGFVIIFWDKLPLKISYNYRIALGIIMILYSFTRLLRHFNSNNKE